MRLGVFILRPCLICFGDSPTFLCLWSDVFYCFDKSLSDITSNISPGPHSPPPTLPYGMPISYARLFAIVS